MSDKVILEKICRDKMVEKGFSDNGLYETRLKEELNEINKLDDSCYFVKLFKNNIKANKNENNLLIPFLLDICGPPDLEKSPKYNDAELLDIDVDFLPVVRTYLKDEWVPKRYGEQYVSNISNYSTFGLKSSLIDIARVLGEDRSEILNLTTRLGVKDDEGDPLTWDSAQRIYKELATYLKEHPKLADVASHLVHADIDWDLFGIKNPPHRKRGMGMHASGLIISSVPLSDYIPMVVSSGNREKGLQASAWVEGLADTDLSSVGFIKFDFLSLDANAKIAECNKLIRERYGLDTICSKDGKSTWSDTSYLNDPKALEMANQGDLKGIFQFDSDGIRKLARSVGISNFDDLAAVTALYRPGPLESGMDKEFIGRKHGKIEWSVPTVGDKEFIDSMKSTYSVMIYQEQIMRYLSVVGKIPISQCQGVIKAISKKKVEKFKKFKDDFIKNSQIILGSEEQAKEKWQEIENWAGYGFNLSHATAYTYISSRQLWQKAHYPIEFFCQDLAHLKTADERIRIYIDDARNHGIKVNKLDLNKSGVNFSIVNKEGKRNQVAAEGDEIYYGFGKIKGIGEEAAQRIVDNQPYIGLEDFLKKCGTDAKMVQPLIALRLFEGDPLVQFKYYEYFKKAKKHEDDRARRYDKSIIRYETLLKELAPKLEWITFDEVDYSKARPYVDVGTWKKMELLKKKYDRCIATFQQKLVEKDDFFVSFKDFDSGSVEIEKDVRDMLKNKEKAEVLYYGFEWDHPLFSCDHYNGQTWEEARLNLTKTPQVLPVEVLIKSCELTQTKTGKDMLKMRCEDGNRQIQTVTVWSEEILRFGEDLQVGACVRLRVKIDKMKDRDGYWYNLESFLWNEKHKIPKSKSQDFRVFVLKPAPKKDESEISIEKITNLM